MESLKNQPLTLSEKQPSALALHENRQAQNRLDELLAGSFLLQKIYGKQPENLELVNQLFHSMLAKYPSHKVVKAFERWLEYSQEFPTPADIIGFIKRNGKPPIKESDIIAIRKKEGCDRTRAEWEMLTEWDAQQQEGWREYVDVVKDTATLTENIRLREKIKELEIENARAWSEVKKLRVIKGIEPMSIDKQVKIDNTIKAMRENGASEDDIIEFQKTV